MLGLNDYTQRDFLAEGNQELLVQIRPAFIRLIFKLQSLGQNTDKEQHLAAFAEAFEIIATRMRSRL